MGTNVGAKKRAGIMLVIIGIVLVVMALAPLVTGDDGFGPAHAGGAGVGVIIAIVGWVLTGKKGHRSEPPA